MSDKNFSRARGSNSDRKFGEAPILGKVSRSPLSAVPRGRKRRKPRDQDISPSHKVVVWTFRVFLLLVLVLSAILVQYFRNKTKEASRQNELPSDHSTTIKFPKLGEKEAISIVDAAFAIHELKAVSDHFILGHNDDAMDAIAALRKIIEKDGKITSCQWLGQKFCNGIFIGEVVTFMDGGGETKNRLAQLAIGTDGKWRIDLDSYIRRSVPEWDVILAGKSETSTIRVFIAKDTYYNGIYSDETKWQAYSLISPDVERTLYGYAMRNSPQDKAMRKILDSEGDIHRATLEIGYHPDVGQMLFEISGVLAEEWVLGESRFDESF